MTILDILTLVGFVIGFVLALAWYDADGERAEKEREEERCSQCKYRAIAILHGADVSKIEEGEAR